MAVPHIVFAYVFELAWEGKAVFLYEESSMPNSLWVGEVEVFPVTSVSYQMAFVEEVLGKLTLSFEVDV